MQKINQHPILKEMFTKITLERLDLQDGNPDGKISQSVWNAYAKENGYEETEMEFISTDDAKKQIMIMEEKLEYLSKTKEEMLKDISNGLNEDEKNKTPSFGLDG